MGNKKRQLILARKRGFCDSVRSVLATLDKLVAEAAGTPVFVLHELIHNRHVTADFERRGVRFVDSLDEVPAGAALLIGAHGVSEALAAAARRKSPRVTDATCPFVRARQLEAAKLTARDTLILVGHIGHPEIVGVQGWSKAGRCFVISSAAEATELPEIDFPVLIGQTTFDAVELQKCREVLSRRFPNLRCRGGLCPATLERQRCVAELAGRADAVVVVGSPHSSNVRRLCETAERAGMRGILAESAEDLPEEIFSSDRVALSAGASTPDRDIAEVERRFAAAGFESSGQDGMCPGTAPGLGKTGV